MRKYTCILQPCRVVMRYILYLHYLHTKAVYNYQVQLVTYTPAAAAKSDHMTLW